MLLAAFLDVPEYGWKAVGYLGQALFTARFLVQWIASEKRKESVVPDAFWWLSISGSALLTLYAASIPDPVFLVGSLVNGFLYGRNLLLRYLRRAKPTSNRVLVPTALAMFAGLLWIGAAGLPDDIPAAWLAVGFLGTALWTGRFIVQWYASERAGRVVVPRSFWYVGLAGAATLLAYSIHRREPVFILGYLFPPIPYIRNLVLIYRKEGAPNFIRFVGELLADRRARGLVFGFAGLFLAAFLAARTLLDDAPPGDFLRYHRGGRLVALGEHGRLSRPTESNDVYPDPEWREEAFRDPPALAVLMAPFGALPARAALVLWTWAAAAALVGLVLLLRAFTRESGAPAAVLWIPAFLVLRFAWDSLSLGEIHPLIVLAAVGAAWLAETGRPLRAGALAGLGAATKAWPVLLLFVFLVRGRFNAFGAGLAALVLIGVLLPGAVMGPICAADLLERHVGAQAMAIGDAAPDDVPGESVKALVYRVPGPVPFRKPPVEMDVGPSWLDSDDCRTAWLLAAGVVVAAALVFAGVARRPGMAPAVYGAALAAAVLASPEARQPEFLAIAVLAAAIAAAAWRPGKSPGVLLPAALILAFALAALPARMIVGKPASHLFAAWCSLAAATLILLAAAPAAARRLARPSGEFGKQGGEGLPLTLRADEPSKGIGASDEGA